jgi:hypothetical protein
MALDSNRSNSRLEEIIQQKALLIQDTSYSISSGPPMARAMVRLPAEQLSGDIQR